MQRPSTEVGAHQQTHFHPLEQLMQRGEWRQCGKFLTDSAKKIEAAGADFLLLCTNTMHKVAQEVEGGINTPLLHIGDAAAERIKVEKMDTVGLKSRWSLSADGTHDLLPRPSLDYNWLYIFSV